MHGCFIFTIGWVAEETTNIVVYLPVFKFPVGVGKFYVEIIISGSAPYRDGMVVRIRRSWVESLIGGGPFGVLVSGKECRLLT